MHYSRHQDSRRKFFSPNWSSGSLCPNGADKCCHTPLRPLCTLYRTERCTLVSFARVRAAEARLSRLARALATAARWPARDGRPRSRGQALPPLMPVPKGKGEFRCRLFDPWRQASFAGHPAGQVAPRTRHIRRRRMTGHPSPRAFALWFIETH